MRQDTYGDAVGVFLADPLSFLLALFERMLVLELGSHVDYVCGYRAGVVSLFFQGEA